MWTRHDVKNIFYSGSYTGHIDEQLIVDICYLLNANLLSARKERIADKSNYLSYLDAIVTGVRPSADIAGGSNGHMALKVVAEHYLNAQRYANIVFEQEFEGLRPDLMTRDQTVLVECGTVEPNKIFSYFKNKKVRRLIILPYPDQDDDNMYAFIFSPLGELADFLRFKEEEVARSMRKIFVAAHHRK